MDESRAHPISDVARGAKYFSHHHLFDLFCWYPPNRGGSQYRDFDCFHQLYQQFLESGHQYRKFLQFIDHGNCLLGTNL